MWILNPVVEIKADPYAVGDTRLSSCLERDGARVQTVEHLMSALAGLGIDNVYVDLTAGEVPIMDGSASPFVFLLQSAGIEEQTGRQEIHPHQEPGRSEAGRQVGSVRALQRFPGRFQHRFQTPGVRHSNKRVVVDFEHTSYIKEVSRARTFGFMQDVENMRAQGLALGGSLDNAIVMDEYRVLNADGLRYEDEFVKHKALDAIGDLYLLGHPLIGAYSAYKSGHALNNGLLRQLMEDATAWEFVTFLRSEEAPAFLRLQIQAA